MKKKKQSVLPLTKVVHKKKRSPKLVAARKTIHRNQPVHKRLALEPVTILVLLCVGVLLCALTLNALADTVTVNAVVPAPPLTQAAIITSPVDSTTTSTQAMVVGGTCPDSSYVDLDDNGVFSGAVTCSSGVFQISLDLSPGSNQLQVQDYNITNSPGPQSAAVTVMYTPAPPASTSGGGVSTTAPPSAASAQTPTVPITTPAVKTPVATPRRLLVTQVDLSIPYISSSLTPVVSYRPTVTGIAPPYSYVVISIHAHSDFYTCTTYANAQGYWTCTFPVTLPPGIYTVDVSAKTPGGTTLTYPSFTFRVIAAAPPVLGIPEPFRITSDYSYTIDDVGQMVSYTIHISGGRAPYAFTVDWGDGKTSTMIQQSPNDFVISHTYGWVDASLASKIVKVQAIDASGQSSTLQLDALVRNPAYNSAIANVTKSGGLWGLFSDVRPWLWIIWPGYAIVILLVFSFWLGEREELAIMMGRKPMPITKRKHSHAHARH